VFDAESRQRMKRLLPYGWGEEHALGGTKKEDTGRYYEMDEDAVFAPPARESGLYSRMTRGSGPMPGFGKSSRPGFNIGDRVSHRHLGEGTIQEIGGRPGWERALVVFDDGVQQE